MKNVHECAIPVFHEPQIMCAVNLSNTGMSGFSIIFA